MQKHLLNAVVNLPKTRLFITLLCISMLGSWALIGCSSGSSSSPPPTTDSSAIVDSQSGATALPTSVPPQSKQSGTNAEQGTAGGNLLSSQETKQDIDGDSAAVVPAMVLWHTDHESGNFYEWSKGSGWKFWDETQQKAVQSGTGPRVFGKAIFNSNTAPGDCQTTISQDVSRSGAYALRMDLRGATKASQGCRVFRTWLDIQGGDGIPLPDEGYYSAWYYLPQEVTTIEWWNIFQFKSSSDKAGSEPMLSFNVDSDGKGERSLYVYHKKGEKSCDCLGSCKDESYGGELNVANLPLQEWFQIEAFVDQSTISGDKVNADGSLSVWVNGLQIIQQENICTLLRSDSRLHWSVNNYTNNIIPPDVLLYVDDAAISAQRLGPNAQ